MNNVFDSYGIIRLVVEEVGDKFFNNLVRFHLRGSPIGESG